MKWTEVPTGKTHSAFQHFMVALGEEADVAVERINSEAEFAKRLATYARNGGLEPSSSQKHAREIMDKNFFGVEEAISHFGINPTRRQLAALSEVPFSEATLQQAKDTHVLVAVFPLSLLEVRAKVQGKGLFYDQKWYNEEAFASERGEFRGSWFARPLSTTPLRRTGRPNRHCSARTTRFRPPKFWSTPSSAISWQPASGCSKRSTFARPALTRAATVSASATSASVVSLSAATGMTFPMTVWASRPLGSNLST